MESKNARFEVNSKRYNIKLNTKSDADIIKQLEQAENVQGYIKTALRYYIQQGQKTGSEKE